MIEGYARILGDNISGDHIISKEYIRAGLEISEMVKYLFYSCRPELGALLKPDQIIVAGNNFGCGSSREYIMLLLKEAGIQCIIAKSFARGFFRSCINQGIIPIECDIHVKEGEQISVDCKKGEIWVNKTDQYSFHELPELMRDIVSEGGLINYYVERGKLG